MVRLSLFSTLFAATVFASAASIKPHAQTCSNSLVQSYTVNVPVRVKVHSNQCSSRPSTINFANDQDTTEFLSVTKSLGHSIHTSHFQKMNHETAARLAVQNMMPEEIEMDAEDVRLFSVCRAVKTLWHLRGCYKSCLAGDEVKYNTCMLGCAVNAIVDYYPPEPKQEPPPELPQPGQPAPQSPTN
ncbi:hypothetical protein GQ42DRAFT_172268 [Ramicandelaber brevisporus]|nr:hypothetical protein GQ42DRAFT_172268 [Ramicandelaber brevisporus]